MVFLLALFFSYLSTGQEIGWKERLQYDLYCVEWDVKPQLSQSINNNIWKTRTSKVFL